MSQDINKYFYNKKQSIPNYLNYIHYLNKTPDLPRPQVRRQGNPPYVSRDNRSVDLSPTQSRREDSPLYVPTLDTSRTLSSSPPPVRRQANLAGKYKKIKAKTKKYKKLKKYKKTKSRR